jgi:hypothetical protein
MNHEFPTTDGKRTTGSLDQWIIGLVDWQRNPSIQQSVHPAIHSSSAPALAPAFRHLD